jgi:hypothetical protein
MSSWMGNMVPSPERHKNIKSKSCCNTTLTVLFRNYCNSPITSSISIFIFWNILCAPVLLRDKFLRWWTMTFANMVIHPKFFPFTSFRLPFALLLTTGHSQNLWWVLRVDGRVEWNGPLTQFLVNSSFWIIPCWISQLLLYCLLQPENAGSRLLRNISTFLPGQIPAHKILHSHCCENLKCHKLHNDYC